MKSGLTFNIKSVYRIDIVGAYKNLETEVKGKRITSAGLSKEGYLAAFERSIYSYCRKNEIVCNLKSRSCPPIIIPPDNRYHGHFLAFALISYDIDRISAFLDYQHSVYVGKTRDFYKYVGKVIYNDVKINSHFNNNKRLNIIMDWAEKKKKERPLLWIGDKRKCKELSEDLKLREYTNTLWDFTHVFTKGKNCHWRKGPEALAYLLYKLHDKSIGAIKASEGKGYLSVAENYFYDYSRKSAERFDLRNAKYNLTHRSSQKFKSVKKSIDFLLNYVFRPKV